MGHSSNEDCVVQRIKKKKRNTMYKCQNTWTYFFFFFYLFDHFVITVFDCVKQLQRIGNLQYDVARVKCKNIFFAQIFALIFYKILIRVKFNLPLPIILNYICIFIYFFPFYLHGTSSLRRKI